MKIKFEFKGETYEAEAEKILGQTWIHFQGKTWCEQAETKTRRTRGAQAPTDEIRAPMPGKIIKVLVRNGQKVQAGELVVIMEAMKMEYTLKADRAAQIKSVQVQLNQQVRLGDQLVSFEPAVANEK